MTIEKKNNFLFVIYKIIATFDLKTNNDDMRTIVKRQLTKVTTDDGRNFIRRMTTVLRPNGSYRYPVDYYDATPGAVKVTERERTHLAVPGYKQFI